MRRALLGVLLGLAACDSTTFVGTAVSCVVLATPDVTEATPGDTLTLRGGPFTTAHDTVVRVGGVDADVLDVARDACSPCDVCRSDNACTTCGACEACDQACSTCEESVAIEVPPITPGPRSLLLVNRFGASAPSTLTILAPPGDTEPPIDTETPVDTEMPVDSEPPVDTETPVDTDPVDDSDTDVVDDTDLAG